MKIQYKEILRQILKTIFPNEIIYKISKYLNKYTILNNDTYVDVKEHRKDKYMVRHYTRSAFAR